MIALVSFSTELVFSSEEKQPFYFIQSETKWTEWATTQQVFHFDWTRFNRSDDRAALSVDRYQVAACLWRNFSWALISTRKNESRWRSSTASKDPYTIYCRARHVREDREIAFVIVPWWNVAVRVVVIARMVWVLTSFFRFVFLVFLFAFAALTRPVERSIARRFQFRRSQFLGCHKINFVKGNHLIRRIKDR